MFDLLLKNDLDGVPVPLPGRAILFANGMGILRARLSDGSVVDGLRGNDGPAGAQGVQGDQGEPGPAGEPGAGAVSRLLSVSSDYLGQWSTVPAYLLQFNATGLFQGRGALSFFVMGANNHKTTAADLTIQLRIGGAVVLTQVFALGVVAAVERAWRVEGRIVFNGVKHTATMRASVDGLAAKTDVGAGVPVADSMGLYVELVASLSAAVSGANLSVINGYAVREW